MEELYLFEQWLRSRRDEIRAACSETRAFRPDPGARCTHSSEAQEAGIGNVTQTDPVQNWKDIACSFLKLGATSYGGPAMMGIMQAELQQKRQWVSKERFLEGLSVVNMLPGATAVQLAIFLGCARGGLWDGFL